MQTQKTNAKTHVTRSFVVNRQTDSLADTLRTFGISRKEFGNFLKDETKLNEFIRSFNSDNYDWFVKLKTYAGELGARIYVIPSLSIDYTRPCRLNDLPSFPSLYRTWFNKRYHDKKLFDEEYSKVEKRRQKKK